MRVFKKKEKKKNMTFILLFISMENQSSIIFHKNCQIILISQGTKLQTVALDLDQK